MCVLGEFLGALVFVKMCGLVLLEFLLWVLVLLWYYQMLLQKRLVLLFE